MTQIVNTPIRHLTTGIALLTLFAGCSETTTPPAEQSAEFNQQQNADPVTPAAAEGSELPVWKIPNIPSGGEAYYAPDSLHLIAQLEDPLAQKSEDARVPG
ncbi:MAG: hypothetical protein DRP64_18600, partial [Verrucomicrobia bacterium]